MLSASMMLACSSVPVVESRLQTMQLYSNMYVVQAGETVKSIAYRYQLSEAELEALNPGLSSNITPGLRINVVPGTVLSEELRARAKTSGAMARQPQLYAERRQQARLSNQRTAANEQVAEQVIVAPAPVGPEALPQRREQIIDESINAAVTEIPASSRSYETVVDTPNGAFTEEVLVDPLDFEPVQSSQEVISGREAMNEELQQYVGEWSWPTQGPVAREFAPAEVGGQGVDIAGVPGQNINAAMAGTVVYSGRDLSGDGNLIIVKHDESLMTIYSHADKLYVAVDDEVIAGDPIASLGWNANQESVLKFEVRKDGNPLDPMQFLPLQ